MVKQHLKRINAPKEWPLGRKQTTFVPRPLPGAHNMHSGMPLSMVLKDLLKYANTTREVKRILNDKQLYSNMQNASRNLGKPDAAFEFVSIITGLLGIDLYARKRKTKKPAA